MLKKIMFSIFALLICLVLVGCQKDLGEAQISSMILSKLKHRYNEDFVIDEIIRTDGIQSCMFSLCSYNAYVSSKNDERIKLFVGINIDGSNFTILHNVYDEVIAYLDNKYHKKFEIIDVNYGKCSKNIKDELGRECVYNISAYPQENPKINFEVSFFTFGDIRDNFEDYIY